MQQEQKANSSSIVVFIGRFSPVHDGHLTIMEQAAKQGKYVLILIGSSGEPRDLRNPWKYGERVAMIKQSWLEWGLDITKLVFKPLHDWLYRDEVWKQQVQHHVRELSKKILEQEGPDYQVTVNLIGRDKDETSYYIHQFPQWGDPILHDNFIDVNSTDIRTQWLQDPSSFEPLNCPSCVIDYLQNFKQREEYNKLCQEYQFQLRHDEMWSSAPYTPTFNTVDCLVVQSGHVLLIRRKHHPGQGLYAMPGGYLNPNERQLDSAIRELREETKLKVADKVLRGSLVDAETFDEPKRSNRGRIITRVFYFQLDGSFDLPKIRGSDDADKAVWVTLDDFINMREQMFEDHYSIICKMIGLS